MKRGLRIIGFAGSHEGFRDLVKLRVQRARLEKWLSNELVVGEVG